MQKSFQISQLLLYNKTEKLKSRKQIDHLFKNGKSFTAFPIKALYDWVKDQPTPLKAGVTVSSRRFKKAVDRNRVKRVLREGYRLQKCTLQNLLEEKNVSLAIFFIYIGKELPVFTEVSEKMGIILQRLRNELLNSSEN